MIEFEDLHRLYKEIVGNPDSTYNDKLRWMEEEEIDGSGLMRWCDSMADALREMIEAIPDELKDEQQRAMLRMAFMGCVGASFGMGWEAHKSYGKPATTLEVGRD